MEVSEKMGRGLRRDSERKDEWEKGRGDGC